MNWEEAVRFCEEHECYECEVYTKRLDVRTKHEKCKLHVPCCANLVDKFRLQHGKEDIS